MMQGSAADATQDGWRSATLWFYTSRVKLRSARVRVGVLLDAVETYPHSDVGEWFAGRPFGQASNFAKPQQYLRVRDISIASSSPAQILAPWEYCSPVSCGGTQPCRQSKISYSLQQFCGIIPAILPRRPRKDPPAPALGNSSMCSTFTDVMCCFV